ncbi:hypothetical protein A9Q84_15265 [Halobacteriovorax marinus]|uniref:Uncharacterized protein n=1 Tax=Halobacteriovorax marinus TaxID=97084 RepID=A0A1Y5FBR9_9BACT|nr:hypothetical protein A9Q84_15265 [Halobacteriovorax marinus]
MKYLIIILTFVSCTGGEPRYPRSIEKIIANKVMQNNSYDGVLQNSIKVIGIQSLGEFPISRIRRFHRRYDFSVQLRFTQECYQLGDTCISKKIYQESSAKRFYTLRKRNEVIKRDVYISFLKTKVGWVLADEVFKTRDSKLLSVSTNL